MRQILRYEQKVADNAKICVLLENSDEYSREVMLEAVYRIVENNMFNEFIDISLRRPYLRFLWVGDINELKWKKNKDDDCECCEIELNNEDEFAGKAVFMRGGFYKNDPNNYMSEQVKQYIDNLDTTKYKVYNELIEETMDNPWSRVILLNINKLCFSNFTI